ncbi:MAG: PAS domain S-box protein [Symploca sp. SIO2G7]|nr:PAS domain S-box protein [Symploca sp. SIO2G7]
MNALLNKLLSVLAPNRGGYLEIDQDFNIIDTSAGAQRFVDCPDDISKGQDIRLGFPELFGVEDILTEIIEGEQESFELKGIARVPSNHSPVYFDLHIFNNLYEEPVEKKLIVILEEVTERMTLEQSLIQRINETNLLSSALVAAKDYVDKIISSMADALLVTKPSGIIKTVNQAAQDLFGYSEAELVGKSISMILADKKFIGQANHSPFLLNEILNNVEVICQTKSGEKLAVAFSCSAIQTETEGLENFIYIGRDITERQRTQKRLAVQYAITHIMSESATLSEATPKILAVICENLEWDLGEIWEPDKPLEEIGNNNEGEGDSMVLKCVASWVKPSTTLPDLMAHSQHTTFPPGFGLPGRVWASHSIHGLTNIMYNSEFSDSKPMSPTKLQQAFGIPLLADRTILGVLTLFSRDAQQADEDLLKIMAAIGRQLGQWIKRKQAEEALRYQQEQTERLLLNILPKPIAERLKQEQGTIAENFAEVTVLFADIVGFTQLSAKISAPELVELLNAIFSKFDKLAEQHGLEKIKTIGDAYMVVGGLPKVQPNHAEAIAEMAMDMQAAVAELSQEIGQEFHIRIGINTGPVVAGVIGVSKFIYDLWGDAVNTASRMESHGAAGKIHLTDSTYKHLQEKYLFEDRGQITVKGKGEMNTYFLLGRKGELGGWGDRGDGEIGEIS